MQLLARVGNLRTVVAIFAGITAVQMTLVVLGNVTEFGTNQAFVARYHERGLGYYSARLDHCLGIRCSDSPDRWMYCVGASVSGDAAHLAEPNPVRKSPWSDAR
jgi:hypothetical protein